MSSRSTVRVLLGALCLLPVLPLRGVSSRRAGCLLLYSGLSLGSLFSSCVHGRPHWCGEVPCCWHGACVGSGASMGRLRFRQRHGSEMPSCPPIPQCRVPYACCSGQTFPAISVEKNLLLLSWGYGSLCPLRGKASAPPTGVGILQTALHPRPPVQPDFLLLSSAGPTEPRGPEPPRLLLCQPALGHFWLLHPPSRKVVRARGCG